MNLHRQYVPEKKIRFKNKHLARQLVVRVWFTEYNTSSWYIKHQGNNKLLHSIKQLNVYLYNKLNKKWR